MSDFDDALRGALGEDFSPVEMLERQLIISDVDDDLPDIPRSIEDGDTEYRRRTDHVPAIDHRAREDDYADDYHTANQLVVGRLLEKLPGTLDHYDRPVVPVILVNWMRRTNRDGDLQVLMVKGRIFPFEVV